MPYILPHEGRRSLLNTAFRDDVPEALILKLYSNDYDVALDSSHTDFVEVSGGGYASHLLDRTLWGAAITVGPDSFSVYGATLDYNFTNAVQVTGYYVVGATTGDLYWAERLYPAAGRLFYIGDHLQVTPRFEQA